MVFFRGSRVLSMLLLGLSACGGDKSDDTGSATGTTTTGGASSSTGEGAPTTGSTDTIVETDTSAASGTTAASETSTGADTTHSTTGISDDSSESGEGTTTGGVVCGLEERACAAVEALGDYEDCGVVDPWDDLAPAWQAARDCALKAASEQRAFKLITWLQGFDSQVGHAFVGLTAESYVVSMFHFDSDPCGGQGCGPVLQQGFCDALTAVPGCDVEPGAACLACEGQGVADQVCGQRQ